MILLLACAAPATLTEIQEDVFTPSCAFTTCHAEAGGSGDLALLDGSSHAELVDVESADSPGAILVVPGDPDASYLIAKLSGKGDFVGEVMPQGSGPLDAERLARVKSWIADGAQDN